MKFVNGAGGMVQVPEDVKWWDFKGRLKNAVEETKEEMVTEFKTEMYAFLEALGEVTVELIYSVTLIGGGILIIFSTVTKIKKFNRWCLLLFCINALVRFVI